LFLRNHFTDSGGWSKARGGDRKYETSQGRSQDNRDVSGTHQGDYHSG
jgi:hypothetical protein